jgi:hypothetical protein
MALILVEPNVIKLFYAKNGKQLLLLLLPCHPVCIKIPSIDILENLINKGIIVGKKINLNRTGASSGHDTRQAG